jgi:hypothetical protein
MLAPVKLSSFCFRHTVLIFLTITLQLDRKALAK